MSKGTGSYTVIGATIPGTAILRSDDIGVGHCNFRETPAVSTIMPAPAVTVNVPEQLPPTVVVNVPEQAAPVVNVIVPDIFQNIPEVRVHIQEVQFPTPIPFECTLPEINVTLEPVFHLGDAVAAASALRLAERYSKLACFGVAALVVFLLFFAVLVYDLQALLEHLALPGHHISP